MASARGYLAAVRVPLASSLPFTCNPKQLARLSTLLASITTTVSSSSLSCALASIKLEMSCTVCVISGYINAWAIYLMQLESFGDVICIVHYGRKPASSVVNGTVA